MLPAAAERWHTAALGCGVAASAGTHPCPAVEAAPAVMCATRALTKSAMMPTRHRQQQCGQQPRQQQQPRQRESLQQRQAEADRVAAEAAAERSPSMQSACRECSICLDPMDAWRTPSAMHGACAHVWHVMCSLITSCSMSSDPPCPYCGRALDL